MGKLPLMPGLRRFIDLLTCACGRSSDCNVGRGGGAFWSRQRDTHTHTHPPLTGSGAYLEVTPLLTVMLGGSCACTILPGCTEQGLAVGGQAGEYVLPSASPTTRFCCALQRAQECSSEGHGMRLHAEQHYGAFPTGAITARCTRSA